MFISRLFKVGFISGLQTELQFTFETMNHSYQDHYLNQIKNVI